MSFKGQPLIEVILSVGTSLQKAYGNDTFSYFLLIQRTIQGLGQVD